VHDRKDVTKDFFLHKTLLMHHSDFFKAAFSRSFSEAKSGTVKLDVQDCGTFTIFIDCLYQDMTPDYPERDHEDMDYLCMLTHIYILAEQLLVAWLKIRVISSVVEFINEAGEGYNNVPYFGTLTLASENLPEGSPFMRLLVDLHCNHWEPDQDDEDERIDFEEVPSSVLCLIMEKFSAIRSKGASSKALSIEDYKETKRKANSKDSSEEPQKKKQKKDS
jgi:hypothetical protein